MLTIITPTFNSAKTIRRNAVSVVNQTYLNFNHIIIDKLSSDETIDEVKNVYENSGYMEKLQIISEKDSGISEAFNKGIELADGDVIGILNSDDYFYDNNVLKKVVDAFKDEKRLIVHGNIFFDDPVYGSNIRKPIFKFQNFGGVFHHPTMFLRRQVYEKFGLYDPKYKYAMDFEFMCRLSKLTGNLDKVSKYIPGEPLVYMSSNGLSWKNEKETVKAEIQALKQHRLWGFNTKKIYLMRLLRVKIKEYLKQLKLEGIIKFWRKIKWG